MCWSTTKSRTDFEIYAFMMVQQKSLPPGVDLTKNDLSYVVGVLTGQKSFKEIEQVEFQIRAVSEPEQRPNFMTTSAEYVRL